MLASQEIKRLLTSGKELQHPIHKVPFKTSTLWTENTNKLVEICYALFYLRCINNGDATLKQISDSFGNALGVDLSGFSQSWKYIKQRKNERLFLETMTNTLKQAINDSIN